MTTDFLSLYEIHKLSLHDCELMVLSSCETNVGADRPLEAGSTLARAFLAAGVRDVVCSQWSVDDAASAALVSEFFRNLSPQLQERKPVDYVQALRNARRSVRNSPDHPAWSAPIFGRRLCSLDLAPGPNLEISRSCGTDSGTRAIAKMATFLLSGSVIPVTCTPAVMVRPNE